MSEVVWLPEALADVERLSEFIGPKHPEAAARVASVILAGADSLEISPQLGRPMDDGTFRRELFLPFGSGAYVLRYVLETPAKAVIIRVFHDREDRRPATSQPATSQPGE